MATSLESVLAAIVAAIEGVSYRDAAGVERPWARTEGAEDLEALSAADRDGHFFVSFGDGRETSATGVGGIAVAEQALDVLLFREPTGDALTAQVALLDEATSVAHAIEGIEANAIEFISTGPITLGTDGSAVTATVKVVVRFRVVYP